MKNLNYLAPKMPTANIAVNKSRVKLYNKQGDLPSYYLQKGQEFQIELFNPTTDSILAKITLNGNVISQGGLVLNPGQRVFLDRYLDVAKKFLFDTYEVANTQEVKEAIVNNGDFKVEFYRESKPRPRNPIITLGSRSVFGGPNYDQGIIRYGSTNTGGYVNNSITTPNTPLCDTFTTSTTSINAVGGSYSTTGLLTGDLSTNAFYSSNIDFVHDGSATMDWMQTEKSVETPKNLTRGIAKKSKSIETGRVEEGSHSDQKFKTVNKDFEWFAFHTIEAKLLPVSQKVNTAEDINVKVYCTNCGAKLGKGHKFCATCGTKA
jgi:hypothetical protein